MHARRSTPGGRPLLRLASQFVCVLLLLGLVSAGDTRAQETTPTPTAPGPKPRLFDASHINLPPGYKIEVAVAGLSVPTTAIFDGADLLVAESGWANTAPPRVIRIKPDWTMSVVASAGLRSPVTGLLVVDGQLYVSHKGTVSIVQPDGSLKDIVTALPSSGDHQNNNIVLGPDGKIYIGQGTTTNSGVVGIDNYIFGWLTEAPGLHEVPCKDITLTGQNFETEDPVTNEKRVTGAYKGYGEASRPGEVIKGDPKCGGSIARFDPDGSNYEMVAWGLRNPFGLEFDDSGQLWATYHGADVRGSRNIYNDPDYLVKVEEGAWYGWPEFFEGKPATDPSLKDPTKEQPQFLWEEHPPLARPFAVFRSHSGINGLDISPGGEFGFKGDAFVAAFGSFLPVTSGTNADPAGYRIIRVSGTGGSEGKVEDFATNQLPGPAYINQAGGFDRPSDLVFGPDSSLYVVDWGASTLAAEGLKLTPLSGAIWRIYKDTQQPLRPGGAYIVEPGQQIPEDLRKPEVRNVPEGYQMLAPQIAIVVGGIAVLALGAFFLVRRRRSSARDGGGS
ncbi:MAG TPA: PQQ-dependent sugar dehydrogenase [Chloroflexia bacterium]